MQVKLRVMQGANSGKVINIPVKEFCVGRDDTCHLRPKSDAISRRHCTLQINDSQVVLHDLGSKNGTYVNSERVEGTQVLQPGDILQIGPLQFQILFDHSLGGAKRTRVESVTEVAARTANVQNDLDISAWLDEADEDVSHGSQSDTRQLRLDETERVPIPAPETIDERTDAEVETARGQADDTSELKQGRGKQKKAKPGKLPKGSSITTNDSREAAADMLKRFFNRG